MTAPTVLALDLSLTATGVALPDGTVYTLRSPYKGPARLSHLRDQIIAFTGPDRPTAIAIEGPAFGRANQMHALGQLAGVVYTALYECGDLDLPVIVAPSTIKKYATGKGNASKAEVLVAAVKRLGYDGSDDNQADALWLRALVMDALGSPVVDMPAVNRSALAAVRELDTEGAA